jgi:hypothetical protein
VFTIDIPLLYEEETVSKNSKQLPSKKSNQKINYKSPKSVMTVSTILNQKNTSNMLDGFDQSFEVLNKKDLFVRAFAHHISEALKKKEIVTIKHRGGFVGGPSPDLKS